MHEPGFIQFAYSCINNGVTGPAFAPRLEFLLIIPPFYVVKLRLECLTLPNPRVIRQYHLVKITPDKFIEVDRTYCLRFPCQVPDTHCAKPKVYSQPGCSVHPREISRVAIFTD